MKNILIDVIDALMKTHLCSSKLLMQGEVKKHLNSNLWHVTTPAPCQKPLVCLIYDSSEGKRAS